MCNFEHIGEFLDLMLGYSLFPRITLPTRTTQHSCRIIDNAFCKLSTDLKNVKVGIILSDISDHYPYFVSIRGEKRPSLERKVKFVRKEMHSQAAYEGFLNDLRTSNATLALNQDPYADPNKNYDILHNHIVATKNKHTPTTYVKFNKYRHKGNKLITQGVMRSIKYKDKLYHNLKCKSDSSPNYNEVKRKLNLYSKLLKRTMREVKTQYYTK